MKRLFTIGLLILLPALPAQAQDLEPRTYINIPVDQHFIGIAYGYSEGELSVAPSVPLEGAELELDTTVFGYVRSLNLGGQSGKVDVAWGRSCFQGSAIFRGELAEADRCGTLDPRLRLSYNFFGAPARTLAEFRQLGRGSDLVIGASLQIGAPWGDYNNENLINTGSNRWMVKPELGVSKGFGRWSVDLAASVRAFSDNDRFFGDITLQQDPLYSVQGHLIYSFPKGIWVSINGNDFDTLGIAWQYRWGG